MKSVSSSSKDYPYRLQAGFSFIKTGTENSSDKLIKFITGCMASHSRRQWCSWKEFDQEESDPLNPAAWRVFCTLAKIQIFQCIITTYRTGCTVHDVYKILEMQDLKFRHRCYRIFRWFGTWRRVDWYRGTKVSEDLAAFVFRLVPVEIHRIFIGKL